jgi:hypothetical protein
MSLWSTILPALISGVVAAALVPFVQQKFVWRTQKRIEYRRTAFDEALNALAMHEADAYSLSLQGNPVVARGVRRSVELRDETTVQMQRARYLVRGFFPSATAIAFEKALDAHISIETIPDLEYRELVTKAVNLMAQDVGLSNPTASLYGWLPTWLGKRRSGS